MCAGLTPGDAPQKTQILVGAVEEEALTAKLAGDAPPDSIMLALGYGSSERTAEADGAALFMRREVKRGRVLVLELANLRFLVL